MSTCKRFTLSGDANYYHLLINRAFSIRFLIKLNIFNKFNKAQFHEVNVVLKAYKDYQERVLAQKKRCQEMMTTKFPTLFPDVSPIQVY